MELTEGQYERIAPPFPKQRGNVSLSNLQVLNAILHVAEHGCKWRGLPARFGNWHTICTRMNRWSKKGVLDRVFEQLQRDQIVRIGVEALGLDSTSVKVHPDGTGARRKTVRNVTTILQVPTCGMTLMRMPPRLGASCWRRSWGLAFPALFVAGVMMALDAVPDTSFFVPAAPTRDFSSGHIICM